jgi:hypothetical protein
MSDKPPNEIWLVKPKSDASYSAVYEDRAEAEQRVESSSAGAELAGPYVRLSELTDVVDAARNVVAQWRGDISRKPHIGRLRKALAAWDAAQAKDLA